MSKVSKKNYSYNKYTHKRANVDVNLKGFLCSCNNRTKDCIRESYNILNKYADILWPPKAIEPGVATEDENDINDDLQKELQELRSGRPDMKRFQVLDSGANNILFVRTTIDDPVKLAESILKEISEKRTQETKFLLRLIPVETTCKAYVKNIEKAFEPLCEKYFSTEPKTFSVIFNHRHNNTNNLRNDVVNCLAEMVSKYGETKKLQHKVDLKNAEMSIVVEVIRGFAFLSVVPHFHKYKKYNLLAFVTEPEVGNSSNSTEIVNEPLDENIDKGEN